MRDPPCLGCQAVCFMLGSSTEVCYASRQSSVPESCAFKSASLAHTNPAHNSATRHRPHTPHTTPPQAARRERAGAHRTHKVLKFDEHQADARGVAGGALFGGLRHHDGCQLAVLLLQLLLDLLQDVVVLLLLQQLLPGHLSFPKTVLSHPGQGFRQPIQRQPSLSATASCIALAICTVGLDNSWHMSLDVHAPCRYNCRQA